uniref:glycosyltransferase family 2 protein n=1 Tax=Gelidibacter sp. TaxID=2018083 RepID=UPI004049573B
MDVSIIIINYNSSKFTINCIESINKFTRDVTYEVIIVDNNSNVNDLKHIEDYANNSKLRFIKSKSNLGFGGGNHLGFQFAKGNYLAFINNDAELVENSLLKLLTFYETDTKIGVLGLHQINAEKKPFKYAYRQFTGIKYQVLGLASPTKYYSKLHNHDLSKPFEVDQVSGAFMFIKSSVYNEVNGFDTNMFLFYEEMDLCLRLKKKGYKTLFYPNSTFIHYMGKSSTNVKMKMEFIISYLYVIQKNYSFWYFTLLKIILIIKYGFKSIVKPNKYFEPFLIILKGGNSLIYSIKNNH